MPRSPLAPGSTWLWGEPGCRRNRAGVLGLAPKNQATVCRNPLGLDILWSSDVGSRIWSFRVPGLSLRIRWGVSRPAALALGGLGSDGP